MQEMIDMWMCNPRYMNEIGRRGASIGEQASSALLAKFDMNASPEPANAAHSVLYVAIVHSPDAVMFTAVAANRDELIAPLAEFVTSRAAERLWPDDALAVKRRAESGELEEAIRTYFESVGSRWDPENLHLGCVNVSAPAPSV